MCCCVGDEDLATEVAALLLRRELVFPVRTGDAGRDHGLLQLVDVERATEACFAVGDDRGGEPVVDGGVALDLGDLVGAQQGVVDAAHDLRDRVGRVEALVGVGVSGQVRVTGDLPAGQVDGLEACTDLLNGLVTGQRAQRVDVVLVVHEVPEDLGTTACEGLLFDNGALELGDLLRRVVAGYSLPARVGVPILLDFSCGLRGAGGRHQDSTLFDLLVRYGCTASHPCQALRMYLPRVTQAKSAVYLLLLPILASFSQLLAKTAKKVRRHTCPIGEEKYSPVAKSRRW